MASATTVDTSFAKKDRVTATRALPGVPEGTEGRVSIANGLTWTRYWVQFDNGVWLGSVDGGALVRSDGWDDLQRRRAEELARPAAAPAPVVPASADAAAPAGDTAPSAAASKVPAHLLERAAAARARKAAAASAE